MKLTKCKRCNAENVYWIQSAYGKWILQDNTTQQQHHCEDGMLKAVKCKYCNADDLHWAEEINPLSKEKKHVLTESYGLPHACDERIKQLAKEKQEKADKYEAEKKRVAAVPEGKCISCNGTGNNIGSLSGYGLCTHCRGMGRFDERTRPRILAIARQQIWPNMKDNYGYHKRRY
jgi:hypothetical protein